MCFPTCNLDPPPTASVFQKGTRWLALFALAWMIAVPVTMFAIDTWACVPHSTEGRVVTIGMFSSLLAVGAAIELCYYKIGVANPAVLTLLAAALVFFSMLHASLFLACVLPSPWWFVVVHPLLSASLVFGCDWLVRVSNDWERVFENVEP